MKLSLKPLNQQVVVLTGASSGIGRLACLQFAEKGAKVVAVARNEAGLASLIDEIKIKGGKAIYVVADVSNFEQVENIAKQAIKAFGRIDTWVNNAAISLHALCENTSPDEYKRLMEVNYLGQVHGALVALKHLKPKGGSLIHTTSVESELYLPYLGAYNATKHAIQGFLDTLRIELKKEGAKINLVNLHPATINTPLFNKGGSKIGVQGRGAPPVYKPDVVVQTMVYAATHTGLRDLACGTAAKSFMLLKRLSPRIVDRYLLAKGFQGMKTKSPKVPKEDNMWEPLPTSDYEKVYGDFTSEEQWSALDWYRTSRRAKVFVWLSAASVTSASVATVMTLLNK